MHSYLLRTGEIFLKGKNKGFFEKKLLHNLRSLLKNKNVEGKIVKLRNRIYAETAEEADWKEAFGITSYSPCTRIKAEYETILEEVYKICQSYTGKTRFRITTNQADPSFQYTKQEMNEKLGGLVIEKTGAKVDLENHDEEIGVEILQGQAYIYRRTVACFGGLPVGVEGNVLLLIENEKSLLAGILAMKRGCALFPVANEKKDVTILEKYCHGTNPQLKLLKEINITECIEQYELQALVVGDTLKIIKEYPEMPVPVLRPLIGYDEKKIKEEMRKYEWNPQEKP